MSEEIKPQWKKEPQKSAPIYAAVYAKMLPVAIEKGWCLSVHGSMARDADFVAVPWVLEAVTPEELVDALAHEIKWFKRDDQGEPGKKPHGRLAYTIWDPESFGDTSRWIDLAVFPGHIQ